MTHLLTWLKSYTGFTPGDLRWIMFRATLGITACMLAYIATRIISRKTKTAMTLIVLGFILIIANLGIMFVHPCCEHR
jgi:hypothetical protein